VIAETITRATISTQGTISEIGKQATICTLRNFLKMNEMLVKTRTDLPENLCTLYDLGFPPQYSTTLPESPETRFTLRILPERRKRRDSVRTCNDLSDSSLFGAYSNKHKPSRRQRLCCGAL